MEEKLKELLSNEEYVKELIELRDPLKISERLEEDDVDISAGEIETIIKLLKRKSSGELTDDELQDVAGGSMVIAAIITIGAFLSACGIMGGAAAAHSC